MSEDREKEKEREMSLSDRLSKILEKALEGFEVALRAEMGEAAGAEGYVFVAMIRRNRDYSQPKAPFKTKIEYSFYQDYSNDKIDSNEIAPMLEEWKRRKGWDKKHQANGFIQIESSPQAGEEERQQESEIDETGIPI